MITMEDQLDYCFSMDLKVKGDPSCFAMEAVENMDRWNGYFAAALEAYQTSFEVDLARNFIQEHLHLTDPSSFMVADTGSHYSPYVNFAASSWPIAPASSIITSCSQLFIHWGLLVVHRHLLCQTGYIQSTSRALPYLFAFFPPFLAFSSLLSLWSHFEFA